MILSKIIFEKKIIIGSILSFIATILGLVSLLFPNIFNLQLKSIGEYETELVSHDDCVSFANFLKKNLEEDTYFYLDVEYNLTEKCFISKVFFESISKEINKNKPEYADLLHSLSKCEKEKINNEDWFWIENKDNKNNYTSVGFHINKTDDPIEIDYKKGIIQKGYFRIDPIESKCEAPKKICIFKLVKTSEETIANFKHH